MKRMTMTIGAVAAAAITGMADAAIIFFTVESAFDTALVNAGKFSKGIEDFEQALISPGQGTLLNDPLNINNLLDHFGQPVFDPGDFIDNLTFQANTNGTPGINDPGVNGLNPRGSTALALFGAGFGGAPNVGLRANFFADSLDILSGPPAGGNHTALGMHVFTFSAGSVQVRVFDKNEQQVGIVLLTGAGIAGQFLGILATDGETIGRVNIWDLNGFAEGVYDVQTYIIPAPSALALLGLAGLFGVRRRRG